MNPLQPLYDTFNHGTNAGKYAELPLFPRMIDLELSSACNFRCLMCPTGNMSLKRKPGFMSEDTFLTIVNQCIEYGTAIRLIGWGEPTLHPQIADFVFNIRLRGLLSHINTNGSKLTEEMTAGLIDAGLSSIKFSFQGVDRKSYREMRNMDFYEPLIETIQRFHRIRSGRPLPFMAVSTTITYENEEQVAAFKERVSPFCDQLSVGRTIFDYMDFNAVRLSPHDKAMLETLAGMETGDKRHPDPCPEVYDKLSIHYDGRVRVCCNDHSGETYLGNVNDTPLKEIWRDRTIETYRKNLAAGKYEGPLCSVCYDYMGLTADA